MSVAADLDALLACIARHNSAINAYVAVDVEGARAAGAAADVTVQEPRSAVDGLTIAVKANISQRGRATDAASRILAGHVAVDDATCVARLRDGGAILVGTTNMDEFGMGSSTERSAHGPTKNPWDHTRSAGGSSGGAAAAVAAGFCAAALGTDTGGSVRQPAAFCGVVGFKPTYGRISRKGVVAYASSLDQVGIVAEDVDTVARVAGIVCGPDDGDATTVDNPLPSLARDDVGVAGLRIGVPRALLNAGGDALDPEIKEAIERTARDFAAQGAVVVDIELPNIEHAVSAYYVIATAEASSNLARYDGVRFGPRGEGVTTLQSLYERTRDLFGDEVRRRILLGTFVLSHGFFEAYLVQAQRVRRAISNGFTAAFADCDVILMPTTPTTAFSLGEKMNDPLTMYLADLYTVPASLAGLPAMSVPVGLSSTQLPIGVQLIGRAWDEGTLFRAARAVAGHLRAPWPTNTERVQP
ncbi:MAG TPA: Asp-tRNA(Asn)/Glu-tRNA(Gln) amidotransferase subunit GatA [Myxococcota bacterium]